MVGIAISGSYIGNVVSFPLSGVLCQCGFAGGWPSVFYLFGEQRCTHTHTPNLLLSVYPYLGGCAFMPLTIHYNIVVTLSVQV